MDVPSGPSGRPMDVHIWSVEGLADVRWTIRGTHKYHNFGHLTDVPDGRPMDVPDGTLYGPSIDIVYMLIYVV